MVDDRLHVYPPRWHAWVRGAARRAVDKRAAGGALPDTELRIATTGYKQEQFWGSLSTLNSPKNCLDNGVHFTKKTASRTIC
jgi:hypothetical protein